MKCHTNILFLLMLILFNVTCFAQAQHTPITNNVTGNTTVPNTSDIYPASIIDGDTVAMIYYGNYIKFPPANFPTTREQTYYSKLVRDVKKTLPYAKEISAILLETYEYIETLPNDKARQKHLNLMKDHLVEIYTPKMKKLTKSQGQLLIKLVDRETNSTSYDIINAILGSFTAWTANVFAGVFGNTLKAEYDPNGDDQLTERVVLLVEQGYL